MEQRTRRRHDGRGHKVHLVARRVLIESDLLLATVANHGVVDVPRGKRRPVVLQRAGAHALGELAQPRVEAVALRRVDALDARADQVLRQLLGESLVVGKLDHAPVTAGI